MVSSEGKLSAPWVLPHKGRESLGFAARIATWTPESLSHVDLLHFLPSTSGTLSVTTLHPSTSPALHWHPPSFNYAPLNHVRLFGIALVPETQRSADSTLSIPCREGKLCWTSHRHDSLWYAYPLHPSIGAHPACSPYYFRGRHRSVLPMYWGVTLSRHGANPTRRGIECPLVANTVVMFSSLAIFHVVELKSIGHINNQDFLVVPRTFVLGHSQCQCNCPYFRGHFPLESVVS